MRDYKFRGKRIDNGEWVYGDLIHSEISSHIVTGFMFRSSGVNKVQSFEVDPETVGQYTGLDCKNGKLEMFEGDTMKVYDPIGRESYIYSIIFEDGEFKGVRYPKRMAQDADIYYLSQYGEIIGNIHEVNK